MMTVGELVTKLETEDPKLPVIIHSHNPEQNGALVTVRVAAIWQVSKRMNLFRDMMDGTPYNSEVFVLDSAGEKGVIIL